MLGGTVQRLHEMAIGQVFTQVSELNIVMQVTSARRWSHLVTLNWADGSGEVQACGRRCGANLSTRGVYGPDRLRTVLVSR